MPAVNIPLAPLTVPASSREASSIGCVVFCAKNSWLNRLELMRPNFAFPVILPLPRAIASGKLFMPYSSLISYAMSRSTDCSVPNLMGVGLVGKLPATGVPHSVPLPNENMRGSSYLEFRREYLHGDDGDGLRS